MHESKLYWTKYYISMLEYVIGLNMKLHYYSLDFSKLTINYFEDRSRLLISSMIWKWQSQLVICYPVVASARDQYTFAFLWFYGKNIVFYSFVMNCIMYIFNLVSVLSIKLYLYVLKHQEMLIWNWSLRLRKVELCDRKW